MSKITDLNAKNTLTSADLVPIVDRADTAGMGPEGTNKKMTGLDLSKSVSDLIPDNYLDGKVLKNSSVGGAKIAALAITAANLANTTITGNKIADTTITGDKLIDSTITSGKVAPGTLSAANIANLTITGGKIANATITGDKLVAGTVTADKIDPNAFNAVLNAGLAGKQNIITGAATTIDTENLNFSRVLVSDTFGKVAASQISTTELSHLYNVSSNIQDQLSAKADVDSPALDGTPTAPNPPQSSRDFTIANTGFVIDEINKRIEEVMKLINPPVYTLTASKNTVLENTTVTFTVATANATERTLYWEADLDADVSPTSGVIRLNGNTGSFTLTALSDATTEGTETLTVALKTSEEDEDVVATCSVDIADTNVTYTLTPNMSSVFEGSTLVFQTLAIGMNSGTLYWTATSSDVAPSNGTITVVNGIGTPFSLSAVTDGITESTETTTVDLRTGSTTGTKVATATISINDIVTTPSAVTTIYGLSSLINTSEGFGGDVAMNSAGTRVAISTRGYIIQRYGVKQSKTIGAGVVRVYDVNYSNNTLSQVGSDIVVDGSGLITITMTGDGLKIAIGQSLINNGTIDIYNYTGGAWVKTATSTGKALLYGGLFGSSASWKRSWYGDRLQFSSDGNILIGSNGNDADGPRVATIRFNTGTSDVTVFGNRTYDNYSTVDGYSDYVSIDSTATFLAAGVSRDSTETNAYWNSYSQDLADNIVIYKRNGQNTAWTKIQTIYTPSPSWSKTYKKAPAATAILQALAGIFGKKAPKGKIWRSGGFGSSIAFSAGGDRLSVFIGAGIIVTYKWNSGTNQFVAESYLEEDGGDRCRLALNAAGDRLVVGSPQFERNKTKSGRVRVYRLINSNWQLIPGAEIFGNTDTLKYLGDSIAINSLGTNVIIGAPGDLSSKVSISNRRIGAAQIWKIP